MHPVLSGAPVALQVFTSSAAALPAELPSETRAVDKRKQFAFSMPSPVQSIMLHFKANRARAAAGTSA
jgi:hypothetical protein